MKIPLHLIISRISKLKLDEQIDELIVLVAKERLYSVRRNELLSLLQGKRTKQMIRNARRAKKSA